METFVAVAKQMRKRVKDKVKTQA